MTGTDFMIHWAWWAAGVTGTLAVIVVLFHLLQPHLFGRDAVKVACVRSHCWIPASLATLIVDHIAESAFRDYRRSGCGVQLDGRTLHVLWEHGIAGLTLVQRWSLYRVGQVGLVSFFFEPYDGEVSIIDCSPLLAHTARRRGGLIDTPTRIFFQFFKALRSSVGTSG